MEPIKRVTLVYQVEDRIMQLIEGGHYTPGTKLPREIDLSRELDVSRGTVREALKFLQAKGVLELKSGKGTFVSEPRTDERVDAIRWLVENEQDLKNFIEVREGIEPLAARRATERGSAELKAELQEVYRQFCELADTRDMQVLAELDEKFHFTIIDHCGNDLIREIMIPINRGMTSFRQNSFRVDRNLQDAIIPHGNILEAILSDDPSRAECEMRKHIHKIWETLEQNIYGAHPHASAAKEET